MNILIISQEFPPDVGGAANRIFGFAKGLADLNNEITVLCSNPIYPKGKLYKGYKNKFFQKDKSFVKFDVYRSYILPVKPNSSFIKRLFSYFSFVISARINLSKISKKFDAVITCSPPLFVALIGIKAKTYFKTKLYLDITDAWPESVVATGFMKKGILFKFGEKFEKWVYKSCDYFLASAIGIKEHLLKKGVKDDKITLVYDGADIELFEKPVDTLALRKRYNLKDKFIVGFSGLLGFAQDPSSIVKVASELRNYKNIFFFIVGEGGKREEAESLAKQLNLQNIKFIGVVPRQKVYQYTKMFDVCLITYKNQPLFKTTVPAKLFDYLSSQKPIIINLKGKAADIILEAKAGLVAKDGDTQDFANKILEIYNNSKSGKEMGENGYKYVKMYYDRRKIVQKLNDFLLKTIS